MEKQYCQECNCELTDREQFVCKDCLAEYQDFHNEIMQDDNRGGTGHGDISWSDADPGL